jgi:hypothetical protein
MSQYQLTTGGQACPSLAQALQEQSTSWRLPPVVEALQALRGVQFPAAVTMVAEIGALTRFGHPREWMKFVGLIPEKYSSGAQRRQAGITTAGYTHALSVVSLFCPTRACYHTHAPALLHASIPTSPPSSYEV